MLKFLLPFVLSLLLFQTSQANPLDNALLNAAEKGDLKQAKALLQRGANPNAQDADGVSALMLANNMLAGKGQHEEIVDLLLAKGAEVNLRNRSGYTALSYGFSQDFIKKFVARGGRATASDSGVLIDWLEGDIFKDSGIEDERLKAEIKAFVKAGVNLNRRGSGEFKTTPLINAVQTRPSVIRLLLDLGADPNIADGSSETPLLHTITATEHSPALRNQICQLLLERGAKVNIRGDSGDTALTRAIIFGNPAMVQALLGRGAEPNFRSTDGKTALMLCADKGFVAYTKLLLEKGAQVNLRDNKGHTALDYATSMQINMVVVNASVSDQELAERAEQIVNAMCKLVEEFCEL